MIILTRLGGHALAVNPDLIERAESTPDTVLTMVDGHKMIIGESLEELVDLVRTWRATIAAQAYTWAREVGIADAMQNHPSMLRSTAARHGVGSASGPADSGQDDEGREGQLTAHTVIQASLARVLRMPQRGE